MGIEENVDTSPICTKISNMSFREIMDYELPQHDLVPTRKYIDKLVEDCRKYGDEVRHCLGLVWAKDEYLAWRKKVEETPLP